MVEENAKQEPAVSDRESYQQVLVLAAAPRKFEDRTRCDRNVPTKNRGPRHGEMPGMPKAERVNKTPSARVQNTAETERKDV